MEKKVTNEDVKKTLREGKDVIFKEERSLYNFKSLFKKLKGPKK